MLHKTHQPAVMVAMRMTEDKAVELVGGDAEQIEIAQQDFRCVAEIEQILALT
jgi:hypothetical protein